MPEGTGRPLLMQVHGGLPPYTDSQGRAKVRIDKDCLPLTGNLRRRVQVETGESDSTSGQVDGRPADLLSKEGGRISLQRWIGERKIACGLASAWVQARTEQYGG